jgi:hypothetical protein
MIEAVIKKTESLPNRYYIVKVSYTDPITNESVTGIDDIVKTQFTEDVVCAVLGAYCKDTYKLTVKPIEGTAKDYKKLPSGYYEVYGIEHMASRINRIRFVRTSTIEIPKIVYVQKEIRKEL